MKAYYAYSEIWLNANPKRWEPTTYSRYESALRLHIWGHACYHKKIDEVDRQEIKAHLQELFGHLDKAPATVETVHAIVSGIFTEAFDDGLVKGNPAAGLLKKILPPKNRRDVKEPAPFSKEDLGVFMAHAQNICSPPELMILKAMAYTGMRLGEALAMRVEDFSLEQQTYHVMEQYRQQSFKRRKFGKQRLIDLPDFLVPELVAYIAYLRKEILKRGTGGRVGYLFLDPDEGFEWPVSQRKIQRLIERVCKAASLGRRNPHDLRHTYATLLLMANKSPAYVQKQLGHHSISMTVDIYGHWVPGEGRQGLDDALAAQPAIVRNGVPKPHIIAYEKKRLQ
jgi:integrase